MIESAGRMFGIEGISGYLILSILLNDVVDDLRILDKSFQLMEEGPAIDVTNEYQIPVGHVDRVQKAVQGSFETVYSRKP